MSQTCQASTPLYSTLAEDPDLGAIVELFVEELSGRVDNLIQHLNSGHWEPLRRVAHQLKGAAGSYGFAPITSGAARLEDAIRQSLPEEEIRRACNELVELCRHARPGTRP
jgi:histidine phosphotransfer protein HptB